MYSGSPQNLRQHLIDSNIECKEIEFPIEVMLNVSTNENNAKHIRDLVQKTNENKQQLLEKCLNLTELPNGIRFQNKNFKIKDFWILLKRTMVFSYICEWKSIVIQFLITEVLAFCTADDFDTNRAKASACLQTQTIDNQSCFISLDNWVEDSHISLTIKYNFAVLLLVIFLQLVVTTLTFSSDINIFINERRNGKCSAIF